MRILTALTYYRPHTSGLTIYAERLAKALVRRGHQVTVLTSQYDPALPREDVQDGVKILRSPVAARISKGVLMPSFGWMATRLVAQNDVVLLHLPQFDAPGIALRGRLMNKPTVITYHSDLLLPPGFFNRAVNGVVTFMNDLAGMFTHKIVAYTEDFARHSPYLSRFSDKIVVIPPPVELPPVLNGAVEAFARANNPENHRPVIGMAARFAAEKGVEVLLDALPRVLEKYPQAMVLFSGQYQDVMGEEAYARRLFPLINRYEQGGQWKFLGVLNPTQMAAFFPNLDVLVVPSLNSTETFGLVQIEAMMNGVPSVASNLPGVRQPVLTSGMGRIAPIGDAGGLAQALLDIFAEPQRYQGDSAAIALKYSPESTAAAYEALFEKMLRER